MAAIWRSLEQPPVVLLARPRGGEAHPISDTFKFDYASPKRGNVPKGDKDNPPPACPFEPLVQLPLRDYLYELGGGEVMPPAGNRDVLDASRARGLRYVGAGVGQRMLAMESARLL